MAVGFVIKMTEVYIYDMEVDVRGDEDEVYFDDDKQEILTIVRGSGGDLWKEETIKNKPEYFKRKLAGK